MKITQFEKVPFIKVKELKLTRVELFYFFFTLCVLVLMHPNCFVGSIQQLLNAFYTILIFYFKYKFYMHVNSPASADENQLKCEKVRFRSEMSEINSRLVTFDLSEWTRVFKSVSKNIPKSPCPKLVRTKEKDLTSMPLHCVL